MGTQDTPFIDRLRLFFLACVSLFLGATYLSYNSHYSPYFGWLLVVFGLFSFVAHLNRHTKRLWMTYAAGGFASLIWGAVFSGHASLFQYILFGSAGVALTALSLHILICTVRDRDPFEKWGR